MNNWIWILIIAFVGWILWSKFMGGMNREKAKELIQSGALVLDVRNPNEFASNGLAGAVNLPLSELAKHIESVEPDKDRVILCHCLSGGRSGMAVGLLKKLGYTRAFNLGSHHRAAAVLQEE